MSKNSICNFVFVNFLINFTPFCEFWLFFYINFTFFRLTIDFFLKFATIMIAVCRKHPIKIPLLFPVKQILK